MIQNTLLAIDAGSYGVRCLLLDVESGKQTSAYRHWQFTTVPGTGGWGLDMDLDRAWNKITSVVREVILQEQDGQASIHGIAVSAMRFSMVVLGEDGRSLLAVPNRDARAVSEAFDLADKLGPTLLEKTGCWPSPISFASRLHWLRAEAPDSFARVSTVLSLGDWITMRLTGRASSDPTQASGNQLTDLVSREWAWDLIDEFDLPKEIFPELLNPGETQGTLTQEAAQSLGLPSGIPVAVGGGDTQTGLLGVGAIKPADVAIIAGSTTPIQWVLSEPQVDPQARMWASHHSLPERWVLECNIGGTGEAIEWLASLLFPEATDPLARFTVEAESAPLGAGGIVSSVGGQLFNAKDMSFPMENLSYSHFIAGSPDERKALMARAAIESLAYGTRLNLDQLQDFVLREPSRVLIGGGLTRSSVLIQVLCNTLAKEIYVGPVFASAVGAALCAGVAVGLYENFEAAVATLQPALQTEEVNHAMANEYEERYSRWEKHRTASLEADQIAASGILDVKSQQTTSEISPLSPVKRRLRTLVTAEMDPTSRGELEGYSDVVYAPYREQMQILMDEDLVEVLQGFDIFITEVDLVDAQVLRQSPQLRVVVSCRGNPTNVDLEACNVLGIPLIHTPGRNADAVADLTVVFMLMLGRKIPSAIQFLHEPGAEEGDLGRRGQAHYQFQGDELTGKTVGIVGLGQIGRKVAQRVSAFQARIVAYDPYVDPMDALRLDTQLVPLETLLAESDFLSLHVPVNEATRGMFGSMEFAQMKEGAFFINTARASLIEEDALIEALDSGHLAGAAIDVFDQEPPGSDHPLLAMDQVIATPHIGGNTYQIDTHQGEIVVHELTRLLDGDRPKHILNPEVLETFRWEDIRKQVDPDQLDALSDRPTPQVSDTLEAKPQQIPEEITPPAEETPTSGVMKGIQKLMGTKSKKPATPTGDISESKAKMEAILKEFIDQVLKDEGLRDFSQGRQVAMHYHLKDMDLQFFTIFDDGNVHGGVGPPDSEMDVTLRMKADLLDGMFTGRTNPTRAAMTGKLSFSGDTKKALSLQKVQKELMRLYQSARDLVGDPGDLSALPDERQPVESVPQLPASQSAIPPASPGRVGDMRDEMVDALGELYAAHLITSTGGNISIRAEGENTLWITPSQLFKGNLIPSMMVEIDLEGNPIDPDAKSPSSEKLLHCAILKVRSDLNVVIHTHAPKATSLALAELPFLPISTEAAFVGEIPRVPFIMPGTRELAEATAEALSDGVAVLLQNHGLVVAASSTRRAIDLTLIIEQSAEKILSCYAVGKEPPVLPEEVVEELKSIGRMMV